MCDIPNANLARTSRALHSNLTLTEDFRVQPLKITHNISSASLPFLACRSFDKKPGPIFWYEKDRQDRTLDDGPLPPKHGGHMLGGSGMKSNVKLYAEKRINIRKNNPMLPLYKHEEKEDLRRQNHASQRPLYRDA